MNYELLKIDSSADAVTTITLNRPDKMNALNAAFIAELTRAFAEVQSRFPTSTRAVILTGAGKAFIAGADIAEMTSMRPWEARRFSEAGHRLCEAIERAPFPVIAAVNGFALGGGCELALACDFVYASETAKFGQPEVSLGIIPGFGGTQRLHRRVGVGHARELIYSGELISADRAAAIGLCNAVFPADQLLAKAQEKAQLIATKGPLAVAAAKRTILNGAERDLPNACELEMQAFAGLFGSDDQLAGTTAFLQKSKPIFSGR